MKEYRAVYGKPGEKGDDKTADDVGQARYDFAAGLDVVYRSLSLPLQTIADNAGEKGTVVVAKVAEARAFGFNALTLEYGDLLKAGVLTPAKVDRCVIQNAASVATVLLAADCIITEKPKDRRSRPRAWSRPWRRRHAGHGRHGRHGRDGWHGRDGVLSARGSRIPSSSARNRWRVQYEV